MSPKLLAHIALFSVAVIYGLNYSIAKDVMPYYLQPRAFILVRVFGAVVLFWLISFLFKPEKIDRKDWPRIFFAALFGVAGNQISFFEGLNLTSPVSASIIMTTNPIVVLGLSVIIGQIKLTWARIAGLVLGLSGALLLILKGFSLDALSVSENGLGNFLIFVNASSYGCYLVVVKPLMEKYDAPTVIRWVFTIGLLLVAPFGIQGVLNAPVSEYTTQIWLEIGYVTVFTTFLAYLMNIFALKTVTSTTVSFYIYLQPLVAGLVAVFTGADSFHTNMFVAATLIFTGVYFVSFYKR